MRRSGLEIVPAALFLATFLAAEYSVYAQWCGSEGMRMAGVLRSIASLAISCRNNCSFVPGTVSQFGKASATLSSGSFAGIWSLNTSGTDVSGMVCNNQSANSSTGVLSNKSGAAAGTYTGLCLQATQPGLSHSPYVQAITVARNTRGTVACDDGPNFSGSVPGPAQRAGFTHCVQNADFTKPQYSNTSSWVDCTGTATPPHWFLSWQYGGPIGRACNKRLTMVSDGGSRAAHLTFLASDAGSASQVELSWPDHWNHVTSSTGLPNQYYAEATFRLSPSSMQGAGPGGGVMMAWWDMITSGQSDWVEVDFIEINMNSFNGTGWLNGTGMADWARNCPSGGGGYCAGASPNLETHVDYTQYHKHAVLITSDGSTRIQKCLYLDDVLQGCQSVVPHNVAEYSQHVNNIAWWLGYGNNTRDLDLYLRNQRVFTCSSYKVGNCFGSFTR
jgi:hypothetical protein